ncbi:MAG: hypothetical protein RLZZ399_302 [Verrucomicrobiota bacterium]|jgi:hypothetical protein
MPKSKVQKADTEAEAKAAPKPKTTKRTPAATATPSSEPPPEIPATAPKSAKAAKATKSAKSAQPEIPLELLTEETLLQFEFTPDAIAVRAYFLAEQRRYKGIHPDPVADWLEAERQILSEIESVSKPGKKPTRKSSPRKPESF